MLRNPEQRVSIHATRLFYLPYLVLAMTLMCNPQRSEVQGKQIAKKHSYEMQDERRKRRRREKLEK